MGDFRKTAAALLKSHDDFLNAAEMDDDSVERSGAVARASCFAAAAYDQGQGYQAIDALGRVFLLALVDAAHPDLDYLRADPKSGEVARLATADLEAIKQDHSVEPDQ